MKQRKIPLRTCIITKESLPKSELLRVVRTPEGEVKVDETGKLIKTLAKAFIKPTSKSVV